MVSNNSIYLPKHKTQPKTQNGFHKHKTQPKTQYGYQKLNVLTKTQENEKLLPWVYSGKPGFTQVNPKWIPKTQSTTQSTTQNPTKTQPKPIRVFNNSMYCPKTQNTTGKRKTITWVYSGKLNVYSKQKTIKMNEIIISKFIISLIK